MKNILIMAGLIALMGLAPSGSFAGENRTGASIQQSLADSVKQQKEHSQQLQESFIQHAYDGQYDWVKVFYRKYVKDGIVDINGKSEKYYGKGTALVAVTMVDDFDYKLGYLRYQQIMAYLIAKGADVNARDVNDMTPLMYAASYGRATFVQQLRRAHAKVDLTDKQGNTAVTWAAAGGKAKIIRRLVRDFPEGAFKPNKFGDTPLMFAALYGQKNTTKYLLKLYAEQGLDINRPNHNGKTARMIAQEEGHADIVALFDNYENLDEVPDEPEDEE